MKPVLPEGGGVRRFRELPPIAPSLAWARTPGADACAA